MGNAQPNPGGAYGEIQKFQQQLEKANVESKLTREEALKAMFILKEAIQKNPQSDLLKATGTSLENVLKQLDQAERIVREQEKQGLLQVQRQSLQDFEKAIIVLDQQTRHAYKVVIEVQSTVQNVVKEPQTTQNIQTVVPSSITCPVGQIAICSPKSDVKQGFEGFESGGSSFLDRYKVPNWFLPMLYMCMIILIFGVIIAAIYENNK